MIEKITCRYCGWKIPTSFIQKVSENGVSAFCENCGTELLNEKPIRDIIISEEKLDQDLTMNKKKKTIYYKIYEKIRIEKNPIARVLRDSDFNKSFKDNFLLAMSRVIYYHLHTLELGSAIQDKNKKLTKDTIDKIYEEINPIFSKRFKREYLENLQINVKDFEKSLKKLHTKLKLNKNFHKDFILYLHWLIKEVYIIASELWDATDLPKFERIIRDDLKCFFDSVQEDKFNKSSRKLNIELMHKIAYEKGGVCLSKTYINNRTKLKWRCKKGHEWLSMPRNILEGTWCPKCYLNKDGYLKRIHEIAKQRGGECLSNKYINSHSYLEFSCKLGHVWKAKPYNIKNGRWCPRCSQGRSERICRKFFETIFKKKFPQAKFAWLINAEGNSMHLDGYNSNLKLAFEYNGKQHYKYIPHWFETREKFEQKKLDDELKKKLCKNHGITLIIIPYYIDFDAMGSFIKKKCLEKGFNLPNINLNIDWKEFNVYSPKKLEELQEIAKENGGALISKFYHNNRTKLKFRCDKDHEWWAIPYHIKSGDWCPHCYNEYITKIKKKKEIELLRVVQAKGGDILVNYENKRSKVRIKCAKGHIWDAFPEYIISGTWCPHCYHNKEFYLNRIKEISSDRGGECLSSEYKNNKTKMQFRCNEGHEWWAKPKSIKEGTWCPDCYRKRFV